MILPLVLCLASPVFAQAARGVGSPARFVTNEQEFRVAAEASARGDITIFIDRKIELTRPLGFPESRSFVRIIGVNSQAAINVNLVFRGTVEKIESAIANGIQLNCRQALIANIEFFGFEMQGSIIKGHTEEQLSIVNCYFHDIGMKEYPYRGKIARTAADSVYTQCIGAHQLTRAHIEVIGCKFERCCANTFQWSHCLYISARSVLVADNSFSDCGNPFGIGDSETPGNVQIIGNRIEKPRPARDPNGRIREAFLGSVVGTDSFIFTRNTVSGDWLCGWVGSPNPRNNLIDFNEYGGMNYSSAWAANTTIGKYIEWREWIRMGFDNHSQPPVPRPTTSSPVQTAPSTKR